MRHIRKGEPDYHLNRRHQNPPTSSEEASSAWSNFRGRRKAPTRRRCLEEEQYGLCGYSEIVLLTDETNLQAFGVHLEHIEPREANPGRTFDHQNLIASAVSSEQLREMANHDVFGGHARGSWWNPEAFIHPLLPDCKEYFYYEVTSGRIVPNSALPRREQAKARLTAYKLNLNTPILVSWRRTRMKKKRDLIKSLLDHPDALRQLAREELLPQDGQLKPFHSAIRQLFGHIATEIMAESTEATEVTPT